MALAFGIIGLGGLGMMQTELLEEMEEVTVVAAADVDATARERFERTVGGRSYSDYATMIGEESLDAVTIVTPHTLHYEQVMTALNNGLHVHVEKPLVTQTEAAEEVIATAADRDLSIQVGYQRHFDPVYRELRQLIADGEIGVPQLASCYLGQGWIGLSEGTWRMDPALSGGGQLIDSGSHLLDVLLWTTETEPVAVTALTDNRGFDVDIDSTVSARLAGPGGDMLATIAITGNAQGMHEQLAIWGTVGRIVYDDGGFRVVRANRPPYEVDVEPLSYREGNRRKLQAFVDAIRTNTEVPVPADFGLRVTKLTEGAYRAAERGERIDIRELSVSSEA